MLANKKKKKKGRKRSSAAESLSFTKTSQSKWQLAVTTHTAHDVSSSDDEMSELGSPVPL